MSEMSHVNNEQQFIYNTCISDDATRRDGDAPGTADARPRRDIRTPGDTVPPGNGGDAAAAAAGLLAFLANNCFPTDCERARESP